MPDPRRDAIYGALDRLTTDQLARIPAAPPMVCDAVAFDPATGRY